MTIEDEIRRKSVETPIVAESVEASIVAESIEAPIEGNRCSRSALVPPSSAVVPPSSAVVPTSSAVVPTSSAVVPTSSENRKISKRKRSTSVSQKEVMNIEKKQKKSIENEKQRENAENVSQRLLVKRKPLFFVDAINQLNEAQINSVKEIGFESVLHYKIEYIPSRLAFSLLKSFDEEKCKIKLYNGKKIHITEEDV